MNRALSFYWQWILLAFGAAASTRAVTGTVAIFVPGLYALAGTSWFASALPGLSAWLNDLPKLIVWLPLALFACFFGARLVLAPYWLYRDKPRPPKKATSEQLELLTRLWRDGLKLYEIRLDVDMPDAQVWKHNVMQWTSDVFLQLKIIDPGEAFAFESIGFQHRKSSAVGRIDQFVALRQQLMDRLHKLRLVTGRHLGVSE